MALCGIDEIGSCFNGSRVEEQAGGDLGIFIATLGSTKSKGDSSRTRPASGKGRSEPGNRALRQAGPVGWALEQEDGISGQGERRERAPV